MLTAMHISMPRRTRRSQRAVGPAACGTDLTSCQPRHPLTKRRGRPTRRIIVMLDLENESHHTTDSSVERSFDSDLPTLDGLLASARARRITEERERTERQTREREERSQRDRAAAS